MRGAEGLGDSALLNAPLSPLDGDSSSCTSSSLDKYQTTSAARVGAAKNTSMVTDTFCEDFAGPGGLTAPQDLLQGGIDVVNGFWPSLRSTMTAIRSVLVAARVSEPELRHLAWCWGSSPSTTPPTTMSASSSWCLRSWNWRSCIWGLRRLGVAHANHVEATAVEAC